ncbi:putative bifunctional diguanylate cyclase/phosphodiesterase [Klenkia brasiliensis]|uniref:Diguanylate cyclase (GGDEF) domain-containing protein n=1 Tax=Klenkia brasiliensis TaxID=333142 RepID=A0A1G7WIS2_9ACTN|nr:bifunctional diguanylate cyclase/phosphodiesterase [Klenkia brasiliensis]SDG71090.1 diguanylate cyclase (GGDEF) domain-containing protein [Klenkia brasiliensis]
MQQNRFRAPAVATPRVMAAVTGFLYLTGGTAVGVAGLDALRPWLPGRHPDPAGPVGLLVVGAVALVTGAAVLRWGRRLPRAAYHLLVGAGTALITLAALLAPGPSSATAAAGVMVFVALDAFFYFAWPAALAHLGLAIAGGTVALAHRSELPVASSVILALVCVSIAAVVGVLVDRASSAGVDQLTGLANRRGLDEGLDQALVVAGRTGAPLAAVLVELDGFDDVQQEAGDDAAADLLRTVARRWSAQLPPGALLARRDGAEFAVLLPRHDGPVALAVVEQLRAALPRVTTAAGVAVLHEGETAAGLLRRADAALARARSATPRRTVLDDAQPDPLLPELRTALATGRTARVGLTVHYQAVVSLTDGSVVGAECLARWEHPVLGSVSPARFIPLAEQHGLVGALGEVVLRQACAEMAALRAATGRQLLLTVNVSGQQFCDPAFPAVVAGILAGTGWPAAATVLEVTESLVEADSPVAVAALRALRQLGVQVAIDDFGTGYSSLARLDTLPADYLKLDHTFTATVTTSTRRARLVRSVVALAEGLDLLVIAEGVETAEQAELLRGLGCSLAQGFLLHRPSPVAGLAALLGGAGQTSTVPPLRQYTPSDRVSSPSSTR